MSKRSSSWKAPTKIGLSGLACWLAMAGSVAAEQASYQVSLMTPETALAAAQAAIAMCRNKGYQVAVAVVDRAGLAQVILRDRFAGAHTVETATRKAWTAAAPSPKRLVSPVQATAVPAARGVG